MKLKTSNAIYEKRDADLDKKVCQLNHEVNFLSNLVVNYTQKFTQLSVQEIIRTFVEAGTQWSQNYSFL